MCAREADKQLTPNSCTRLMAVFPGRMRSISVGSGKDMKRREGRGTKLGGVEGAFTDTLIVKSSSNTPGKYETESALFHRKGTLFAFEP